MITENKANRRDFIKGLALTGLLLGVSPLNIFSAEKNRKLNILVLGGTNFLGPAIVNAGLKSKHKITLFNRGITNPHLFSKLPLIKGDRKKGIRAYDQLKKHKWDVVIDVWPDKSRFVDEATKTLKKRAGHYVFISSIAVYKNFQEVGLHEGSEVIKLSSDKEKWHYGEEKRAAENLVIERFPENHTILRPGPIKGWRDSASDLLYWLVRLKNHQNILAPGSGRDPLQFIDVKDVGRFVIKATENNLNGIFNTTGPLNKPLLWKDFLKVAKKHLNSKSEIHWANEAFLKKNKVRSFEDLPLWAPLSEDKGFMQISAQKANAAGFEYSPLGKTIDDCLSWYEKKKNQKGDTPTGLKRAKEVELLKKLIKKNNG